MYSMSGKQTFTPVNLDQGTNMSFKTFCLWIAFLLPPEHRRHWISLPFLLSQHTVQILIIAATCQRLLGLMHRILKFLLLHLALGQPINMS